MLPTIFVSENLRDLPESYVSVDNYRGTHIGTEYLYSIGHRNILYFGQRKGSVTHQLRADGYIDACRELGIEPNVFASNYTLSSVQAGAQMAKQVFAQHPFPYTAIFAATDSLALGVLAAADEAGIRIPEDVSLMGFDNILYTSSDTENSVLYLGTDSSNSSKRSSNHFAEEFDWMPKHHHHVSSKST